MELVCVLMVTGNGGKCDLVQQGCPLMSLSEEGDVSGFETHTQYLLGDTFSIDLDLLL